MKVHVAEFEFDDFYVRFVGPEVTAYRKHGEAWTRIGMIKNDWTSKNADDGGVMCRKYKPRIKDAVRVLKAIQSQGLANA